VAFVSAILAFPQWQHGKQDVAILSLLLGSKHQSNSHRLESSSLPIQAHVSYSSKRQKWQELWLHLPCNPIKRKCCE